MSRAIVTTDTSPGPARVSAGMAARCRAASRVLALVVLALLATGPLRVGTAAPHAPLDYWLDGFPDYAPSGMPDFSQCRTGWSQPGSPAQWTYAGPVALADALWWLDSLAEPQPRPPLEPSDHHSLVTAYPVFGPPRDDHSVENLPLLIEDIAFKADTDGRRTGASHRGTRWPEMLEALESYLEGRSLQDTYAREATLSPPPVWLTQRASSGTAVVVLLGVWERQDSEWRRIGGHYAALAGAVSDVGLNELRLSLADPLADAAAITGSGRLVPIDPSRHSCRTAPREHDDARLVSHDTYQLDSDPALPLGQPVLVDYFVPSSYGEAAAFRGQNPVPAMAAFRSDWSSGPVVMAVDGALAIRNRTLAGPTPATPSPTAHAAPTRTTEPTARPTELPWPTIVFPTAPAPERPPLQLPLLLVGSGR